MRAVVISIFMLVIGVSLFFCSLHMIDNAWNMQAGMMDKSILLQFDKGTLYEAGMLMTFAGFFISVASALTVFINFKIERDEKKFKDENDF